VSHLAKDGNLISIGVCHSSKTAIEKPEFLSFSVIWRGEVRYQYSRKMICENIRILTENFGLKLVNF
jgi:hypothetical protein